MKERVLITGGAGFIGGHLVDALIGEGFKVRVLDNLEPPVHNGRLPQWFNPKAEFIKGDVRNRKDLEKSLKGMEYVFHLAAYMDYHPDFSNYFRTNSESTAAIYEIILEKKLPVKKIIFASSQSLYGEGKYHCPKHGLFYPEARSEKQLKEKQWEVICPKDGKLAEIFPEEEGDQLNPQIPYGISKMAGEKLAITLGKIYNLPSAALRYSIVQGSRQSFRHFYSGALRDFSVRALAGLPIIMQEDGNQIRDFVNVRDVVSAHLKVLKDRRADYEIFNVGSGRGTKVMDLAKLVCQAAGVNFKPIISGTYRINAPRHSLMNIDKLKGLGWFPRQDLKDNVNDYLTWLKQFPEAIKYWQKTYRDMQKSKILKK